MTLARFTEGEFTEDGSIPAWLTFVREVGTVRPGTFTARVDVEHDTPYPGYRTERYPEARIVHGPSVDEGVRVVADSDATVEAFQAAANRLGVHLAGPGCDSKGCAGWCCAEPRELVVVGGPHLSAPTVQHCDVTDHPLGEGAQWWLVKDTTGTRGWKDNHGAACAEHRPGGGR